MRRIRGTTRGRGHLLPAFGKSNQMAWWWDRTRQMRSGGAYHRGFEPTIPSEPPSSLYVDAPSRFEVCPPSLFDDDFEPTRSGVRSLLPPMTTIRQWLQTGWYSTEPNTRRTQYSGEPQTLRVDDQLRSAQRVFIAALADIDTDASAELVKRARAAHSLRELWHLRNPLFTMVSINHCESIARNRLAELNQHFTIREQCSTKRAGLLRAPATRELSRSQA